MSSVVIATDQPSEPESNPNNNAASMHSMAQTSNAILARLKEVEANNANMAAMVEKMKHELTSKDDKIKDLSADKRKDMETMIDNAIEKWLNSLTDVPPEVKQQFKSGICKIAEQADTKNAAWEIVCNASLAHQSNVQKIDELLKTCNEQGETIKTLMATGDPSFQSEASRSMPPPPKRARMEAPNSEPPASNVSNLETRSSDAWCDFQRMMHAEMSTKYF